MNNTNSSQSTELWDIFAKALAQCASDAKKGIWSDTARRYRTAIISGERRTLDNLRKVVGELENHSEARTTFTKVLKSLGLDLRWGQLKDKLTMANEIGDIISTPSRVTPNTLKIAVSYSAKNRKWAEELKLRFASWRCDITLLEQGLELKMTRESIRDAIEDSDCLLVLLCPEIFRSGDWTRRHVDWAKALQGFRQSESNRHPMILAAIHFDQIGEIHGLENLVLNLHGFESGKPNNRVHNFNDTEHLIFRPTSPTSMITKVLELFSLETCHIKSRQDLLLHGDIFEGAMRIYERLIPDESERDPGDFIAQWISSNDEENTSTEHDRKDWIDWLSVLHRDRHAYGAFWANVDRRSGLGAITFWGMKAGMRSDRLSTQLVKESLDGIADYLLTLPKSIKMKCLFFDVEPVDFTFFNNLVEGAYQLWHSVHNRNLDSKNRLNVVKRDIHPESGKSFLLTFLEKYATSDDNAEILAEQVRRYRRISLYTSFEGRSQAFKERGWSVKAFIVSDNELAEGDSVFSTYVQPPIIPSEGGGPVRDENSREFYMFAIVDKDTKISGEHALTWQYDSFLADQYSSGKDTELAGWDDYMIQFKKKNLSRLADSRLKAPRLGKSYDAAKAITFLIRKISRSGGAGRLNELDITL